MAGQIGYHLLAQAHAHRAPWAVTTAVARFPVLVLGMGAALAHLLRADSHTTGQTGTSGPGQADAGTARYDPVQVGHDVDLKLDDRLTAAIAAARHIVATGHRVSRRTLRAAGLHGANAYLGTLARYSTEFQPTD